ncbi:MAG: hypothetical protein K6U88_15025 [Dehalococcoidia bacterium]|nr:hypothetical protein [Dehalococcoidia bacterium]
MEHSCALWQKFASQDGGIFCKRIRMSEVIAQVQIRMPFALKHGDTFLVADTTGDITNPKEGMFDNDTRVLSYLKLTLAGHAPEPLSASVSRDNVYFVAHMTNRRLPLIVRHHKGLSNGPRPLALVSTDRGLDITRRALAVPVHVSWMGGHTEALHGDRLPIRHLSAGDRLLARPHPATGARLCVARSQRSRRQTR